MAKKPKHDPDERVRKLGEREETISEKLTQIEIEDERSRVCGWIQTRDELDTKRKSVNADFKAKIAEIENALGAITKGRRDTDLTIEEWLTRGNEVVRVRKDTGEQIGARNARAEELQEKLFKDDEPNGETPAPPPTEETEEFGGTPA
jgi:hypothetical protein